MDGQVFLWAVFFAVVGFWLFYKLGNVLAKVFLLILALGGLYTSMIFWKEMDPAIAIGIVALAVVIAGGSMLFRKKGKTRNEGEIPLGLFLVILGCFAFLTVIGALSSGEGFWKMVKDFFVSGADVVRELWDRTDQGIEEVNR
ncbi:MAG: hypothetical protein JWO55_136 [Candidatus Saccharibacteria bacterium]|nr:hypothetical protein [Candidatus Saccharibacteria bacterium]